ncbi:MAG: glycosyltransferase family 2 protein [Bacteroidales bacterium]|nr:glycosyltransferase family 2 protein [Bacteroidales bacterium]
MDKLIIVMPCYNEEAVLEETTRQLLPVLESIRSKGKIKAAELLYVSDGSSDGTWPLIESLAARHSEVHGVKLAHNAGHQNALWAGLEWTVDKCDAVISMDADLQHDINAIEAMVDKFNEGYEIVYGVRGDRATDSWFKKRTALFFYNLMIKMGVDIIRNHADYRLMSNRAIKELMTYPERNIFLRGLVKTLGFNSCEITFEVKDRFAGESKYTVRKMMNFAMDGITSFSVQPLRWITALGVISLIVSFIEIIYTIIVFCQGKTIPGWSSLTISLWLLGGMVLLAMGVIGEYIGKIYKEVKRRPRFIIEKSI